MFALKYAMLLLTS